MRRPRIILFDLDGTVSDSARGILAALRHAFAVTGVPAPDSRTERGLLGPPFYESLPPLIGDVSLADVIAAYREFYAQAMYDTVAFDGVPALLRALRADGARLAIATSKPERYAVPIVEHLGLAGLFDVIGGDALDGSRGTKALVIAHVLTRLDDPDPSGVLMVGDRSHDVLGARAHGIGCLGAGWGYGLPGELVAAQPLAICPTVADLVRLLEPEARDAAAS